LGYAEDLNLLGDDIETIKKNTQTLIDAGKEVGLEVNQLLLLQKEKIRLKTLLGTPL
jgi:hypothetical protein